MPNGCFRKKSKVILEIIELFKSNVWINFAIWSKAMLISFVRKIQKSETKIRILVVLTKFLTTFFRLTLTLHLISTNHSIFEIRRFKMILLQSVVLIVSSKTFLQALSSCLNVVIMNLKWNVIYEYYMDSYLKVGKS